MISGMPRPLPECKHPGCGVPMARAVFVENGGKCSEHLSVAEALQRVHSRSQLARVSEVATKRANARIDALAARRLGRERASA